MDHISLREFSSRLDAAGVRCTQLGIGPVSEIVVRAAFESCRDYDCPAIFIASRNQVDCAELGHGYLMGGMDQAAFVGLLERVGAEVGYAGPVYVCRDHGGPWQRNIELDEKCEPARAMDIAKQSFRADVEAGFNYLHVDPTKCPYPYTMDELCERTVELVAFCEDVRAELGKPPIDYEVGTEDIQGGLTSNEAFEAFVVMLTARLEALGLPQPTCVVGQTGTLTRLDHNVGRFDRTQTAELAAIAARCGVGLKEHNGDYLSAATCRIHPELGVAGMNVAPEFGLVETDACLALADLEQKLVREGWLAEGEASGLRRLFLDRTFADSPWRKWMTDDLKALAVEDVEADASLRLLIARVCGHYVYDDPDVKAARAILCANIDAHELVDGCAERFIVSRVRAAIDLYLEAFHLRGVTKTAEQHQPQRTQRPQRTAKATSENGTVSSPLTLAVLCGLCVLCGG